METLIENNVNTEIIKNEQRLGSCEVCSLNASIYTCPKCEMKTCSLKCSKIHKAELECDGIRDRTKYKPLKQMTTMDFMNDYYFLEEATRFTKEIKCNPNVRNNSRLNLRTLKLRKEAFTRNVQLYYLNNGFLRRKQNQSVYKAQEQAIYWFVELVFTNANVTIRKKFSENTKIEDMLKVFLDNASSEQRDKQLEFYRAEGVNKLRVMLKAEGLKSNKSRYFEMNLKKTLKANLSGKVIIEYPTLHVLMPHSADDFDVIPSDDESVADQLKAFKRTLREEVFSKKVGENPPLILKPEELPIISEVVGYSVKREAPDDSIDSKKLIINQKRLKIENEDSDEEVNPENYLFSNES